MRSGERSLVPSPPQANRDTAPLPRTSGRRLPRAYRTDKRARSYPRPARYLLSNLFGNEPVALGRARKVCASLFGIQRPRIRRHWSAMTVSTRQPVLAGWLTSEALFLRDSSADKDCRVYRSCVTLLLPRTGSDWAVLCWVSVWCQYGLEFCVVP